MNLNDKPEALDQDPACGFAIARLHRLQPGRGAFQRRGESGKSIGLRMLWSLQ